MLQDILWSKKRWTTDYNFWKWFTSKILMILLFFKSSKYTMISSVAEDDKN